MWAILDRYIPQIEKQQPHFEFGNNYYADSDKASIDFKYMISSYDPATCHPKDQGRLMPITVIEGQTIHPQPQNAEEKPVPVIELP